MNKIRRLPTRKAAIFSLSQLSTSMGGGVRRLLPWLCLWLALFLFPLAPAVQAQERSWPTIDETDGLPSNHVHAVFCDREGNLWFATSKGVAEFTKGDQQGVPGSAHWLRVFTTRDGLAGDLIASIAQDRSGNLWFGTSAEGVSRYDGKSFKNFTTKDGLANSTVYSILPDRSGNLWFGTEGGVSRYDGKSFKNFTTKDGLGEGGVTSLFQDSSDTLWFGTASGVSRYDGKSFKNLTTRDGSVDEGVSAILQDRSGTLWFGTSDGRVSRYDGKSFKNFTNIGGVVDERINSIFQDSSDNLWFAGYGGLSLYNGKSFQSFTTKNGVADNAVTSIGQDSFGNLWFGSDNGVSRYGDRKSFKGLTRKDGLVSDHVNCILQQDNSSNLWFGTDTGVSLYDGKGFKNFSTIDGLGGYSVISILQDGPGNLWFGTESGLSLYDGKTFKNFTKRDGLAGEIVFSSFQDNSGQFWFGTESGLSLYDGKSFRNFTKRDGLVDNGVLAISQDKSGNLWFGTDSGVSRYDGKSFKNFTREDGLADDSVRAIFQDNSGNLWFGTTSGLSLYDGKSFKNFTTKNGLVGEYVSSIFQDNSGTLWFGTESALNRYDGKSFQSFTTRDGLAEGGVSSILQDSSGHLWFGTKHGVGRYLDQSLSSSASSVLLFKRVRFQLASYGSSPSLQAWSYRLDDGQWTAPSRSNSLVLDYWHLASGTHTLALRLWDGTANPPPTSVTSFEVSDSERTLALVAYLLMLLVPVTGSGFYGGKRRAAHLAARRRFNPYRAGLPVGADLFTGREDIVRRLLDTLHSNCIYLQGERRIGKTSLLHHLSRRLRELQDPNFLFIPVFVDLQGVPEAQLWRVLLSALREAVNRWQDGSASDGPAYDELVTDLDFELEATDLLEKVQDGATKKVKFVLLVDEVDTLNSYALQTNLALRRLFNGELRDNMICVLSGFALRMNWGDKGEGSPPFNYLTPQKLAGFSPAEARTLILRPVAEFYSYEPAAVEHLIEISETRPFVIQSLCQRVIDRILDQKRRRVTLADVMAIEKTTLSEAKFILQMGIGTQELPSDMTEALARIAELQLELRELREIARVQAEKPRVHEV